MSDAERILVWLKLAAGHPSGGAGHLHYMGCIWFLLIKEVM
jgi:hypothetical protein